MVAAPPGPIRRPSRRAVLVAVGALLLTTAAPPARAAADEDADEDADKDAATALIRAYQDALLSVMKRADALDPAGRAEALDEPVRATFDFARMARAAAGKAWRTADPATQEHMVEAFAAYSVATHADRFDGYSGESFHVDGTAPGPADTLLVNTHIARPSKDDVPITYVVADGEDGEDDPRVIDVLLEGSISEVAMRRSEWSAIGRRDGLPGLIDALGGLTARLLEAS